MISATHQDLHQRVAEGAFRHDLYFRLITFEIEMPPLRQRRERHCRAGRAFPRRAGGQERLAAAVDFGREALAALERRPWYGNVRELRNAVEHAMILARGGAIVPEHLPPPMPPAHRRRRASARTIAGRDDSAMGGAQLQISRRRPAIFTSGCCGWSSRRCWGGLAHIRRPVRWPPPAAGPAPHHAPQEAEGSGAGGGGKEEGLVGWVERSEPHHCNNRGGFMVGLASLDPPYILRTSDGRIGREPKRPLDNSKGIFHETRLPRGVHNDRGRVDHGHRSRTAGRRDTRAPIWTRRRHEYSRGDRIGPASVSGKCRQRCARGAIWETLSVEVPAS